MLRPFWIGLSLLLLLACNQDKASHIPPGKMQEILKELHYADAASERFEAKLQPRTDLREDLYDQIMERYGLSRAEFYDSYRYYIAETYMLDSLYKDMIDTFALHITRLEDSISAEKLHQHQLEKNLLGKDSLIPKEERKPVWQQEPK